VVNSWSACEPLGKEWITWEVPLTHILYLHCTVLYSKYIQYCTVQYCTVLYVHTVLYCIRVVEIFVFSLGCVSEIRDDRRSLTISLVWSFGGFGVWEGCPGNHLKDAHLGC
jgi:hypothetical protein